MEIFLVVLRIVAVFVLGGRYCTPYYKDAFIKAHMRFNNPYLSALLILNHTHVSMERDSEDLDKLSIVGAVSYVCFFIMLGPLIYTHLFLDESWIYIVDRLFLLNIPLSMFFYVLNNFRRYMRKNPQISFLSSRRSVWRQKRRQGKYDIGEGLATLFVLIILLMISLAITLDIWQEIGRVIA